LPFNTRKSTIIANFCNPEYLGLKRCENGRDSGIPNPGIAISRHNPLVATSAVLTRLKFQHLLSIQMWMRRSSRNIVGSGAPTTHSLYQPPSDDDCDFMTKMTTMMRK